MLPLQKYCTERAGTLELNLLSHLHEDRKKSSDCVQTAWDGTLPLEREMGAIISTGVRTHR